MSSSTHSTATTNAILETATAIQEKAVDDEIHYYDTLLQDDTALAQLRASRLAQLRASARAQQAYRDAGHGSYDELSSAQQQDTRDLANSFFAATKASPRLVVHFYRPTSPYCDVYHALLRQLAPKFIETRFVRINVEDCDATPQAVSFLVERLRVRVMPTVVLIRERKVVHQLLGFDEVPGGAKASAKQLARVLHEHKMVDWRDEFSNDLDDDADDSQDEQEDFDG